MLTAEQKTFFREQGYLLIRDVLSQDQVRELRAVVRPMFDHEGVQKHEYISGGALPDLWNRHPELQWLLFLPKTLEILRSLLGQDFVYLRESAAHLDGFGEWHKDTSQQERAGLRFQWDDDFQMLEFAYYLQDNNPEYGGGLDVEPRSHFSPDPFVRSRFLPARARRLMWKSSTLLRRSTISIPNKEGDLVLFHFRLNHRSTPCRATHVPPEKQKIALFQAASANNRHVELYQRFLATRSDYGYLDKFTYSESLLEQARKANVVLG
jgi:hypothetical protein